MKTLLSYACRISWPAHGSIKRETRFCRKATYETLKNFYTNGKTLLSWQKGTVAIRRHNYSVKFTSFSSYPQSWLVAIAKKKKNTFSSSTLHISQPQENNLRCPSLPFTVHKFAVKKKQMFLKSYVTIDFPTFLPPPALSHHNIDFPNAAKWLNYVQKITTLVVVKRTRTNTLARTCRKHNRSSFATINWVHFVFRKVFGGGCLRAQNHGQLCFLLHTLRPLPTFFLSSELLKLSSFYRQNAWNVVLSIEDSWRPLFRVVSERLRRAAQKYTTSGFPRRFYVSSRRKLVAAIVFDPSHQKATIRAVVTKTTKTQSVIVVRRRRLNVEVYSCYNKTVMVSRG